ncbi:MAG: biotin transporter BioY [Clostridiales bacterium]|nr:biotin transporter BioY [Clostridiales bacterium]
MNARELVYIAVAAALVSVSAWLAFPLGGIPITLQTLTICLAAALLGWKRAVLSVLAYLALGGIGVPVFAGFTGGVAKLLSPTGGYLFGFMLTALCVGLASEYLDGKKTKYNELWLGVFMLLGILLCYAMGTVWFALMASEGNAVGFWGALTVCVLPYLPFDCIKIVFAVLLSNRLKKHIK